MTLESGSNLRRFPFVTVLVAAAALFAFLGLSVLVYRSPNYLGEPTAEPAVDPAAKLNEIRSKNEAALEGRPGSGSRMSATDAQSKLLSKLKSEKDVLPFPAPEPPPPAAPKK